MDWSSDSLYSKAKLYAQRAHDEPIESALFGFWMSLSLELMARAALASIHPVLLADPKEPDNIQYAFGITPKNAPKSIVAKALFSRCSIFIPGFTDGMTVHCLIMADRRNTELHSGAAAFEGIDNSAWLPATYEVIEVLLKHLHHDFMEFLGADHGNFATELLRDRRDSIKKEVLQKISEAKKTYSMKSQEWKADRAEKARNAIDTWIRVSKLRKECECPSCGMQAVMSGESIGRSPVRIDEITNTIIREARVLPNALRCMFCDLSLQGYQQIKAAGLGAVYTVEEEEDPIKFFGIIPEEYVDVERLIRDHFDSDYENE